MCFVQLFKYNPTPAAFDPSSLLVTTFRTGYMGGLGRGSFFGNLETLSATVAFCSRAAKGNAAVVNLVFSAAIGALDEHHPPLKSFVKKKASFFSGHTIT
jgi:hypothetical protein